jgi:large subunit ribosomal protein L13
MKASEITKKWYVIDATDVIVGRLAAEISRILRGKHKPFYTPHMDCGDHVIVINAEKIAFTGRKWNDKEYHRHTGYPGGLKTQTAEHIRRGHPDRVLYMAVSRMVPRGPLGEQQMTHLRIYAGDAHPHAGQNPEVIDFAGRNRKNSYNVGMVS